MRAVVARELIVATRTIAVPLAAWGIATLLLAFVGIWSPGAPVPAPMDLYEQTRLLEWILLAVVLPWMTVRVSSGERAGATVLMVALTSLHPALVVASQVVARVALLQMVSLAAIPSLIIAQQTAAVPLMVVLGDLVPILGLVLLVAVSSTASVFIAVTRPGQWLLATTIVFAVLLTATAFTADVAATGLLCWLAGGGGAAGLCAASGRSLLYLRDARAA